MENYSIHVPNHQPVLMAWEHSKIYKNTFTYHKYPSLMILDDWYMDCVFGCIWLQNFMSCQDHLQREMGCHGGYLLIFPSKDMPCIGDTIFRHPNIIFVVCLNTVSPCISTIPLFVGEIPRVLGKFHCHVRYLAI